MTFLQASMPVMFAGLCRGAKGMHWRTYERLRAEHEAHVNASLMGMAQRFKLNIPRLE